MPRLGGSAQSSELTTPRGPGGGGVTLRLTHVSFARVEFALLDKDGNRLRPVEVRVGSGTSWFRAVRFPIVATDATASTGNEVLDRTIRERAAEELARLEATTRGAA
jgi:hypothetical protein